MKSYWYQIKSIMVPNERYTDTQCINVLGKKTGNFDRRHWGRYTLPNFLEFSRDLFILNSLNNLFENFSYFIEKLIEYFQKKGKQNSINLCTYCSKTHYQNTKTIFVVQNGRNKKLRTLWISNSPNQPKPRCISHDIIFYLDKIFAFVKCGRIFIKRQYSLYVYLNFCWHSTVDLINCELRGKVNRSFSSPISWDFILQIKKLWYWLS